ncbi:MAG: DUF2911 domain-containing protein [Bryobacterales bacterium]
MKLLRICISIVTLLGATTLVSAQQKKAPASPVATATATIGGKTIKIDYSSPRVRDRAGKLFGKDGRIGQDGTYPIWRAGANTSTTLHTTGDLAFGSLAVPSGDYSLYVNLADANSWELVINKQTGQWGTEYDKGQDVGRVKMTMSKPPAMVDNLTYTVTDKGGNKGQLTLEWENHRASVDFTVK